MLTNQDKEDIKDIVVDVIQDTIMPAFDLVATKEDLARVENRLDNRLDGVEHRLDGVEHRLDTLDRKFDRHAADQLDINYRLKAVERVPVVALALKKKVTQKVKH